MNAAVAAEWAKRQGEEITIAAVEFCRILSGRGEGRGLLNQEVPF